MKKPINPELTDEENPEWNAQSIATAIPANELLPRIFSTERTSQLLKSRGRPRIEFPKERINIRLSHAVIEHFKSTGAGWQTRIDQALKQYIAEHPVLTPAPKTPHQIN